jgi:hypothetical protein
MKSNHPDAKRTLGAALPVWTVVALSIGGLLAHSLVPGEIVSGITREWEARAPEADIRGGVVDGRAAAAVDDAIESHHPFREAAVPFVAAVRYSLFRQGNDGVVVGREGRLFTSEELIWDRDDPGPPRQSSRLHHRR